MNMIYDSPAFVVVHYGEPRLGYEIVDKDTNKGVYLDGDWALAFKHQCQVWEAKSPTEEEADEVISGFAVLAQNPLVAH